MISAILYNSSTVGNDLLLSVVIVARVVTSVEVAIAIAIAVAVADDFFPGRVFDLDTLAWVVAVAGAVVLWLRDMVLLLYVIGTSMHFLTFIFSHIHNNHH